MQIAKMILCGVCVLGAVSQIFRALPLLTNFRAANTMDLAGMLLMGTIFAIAAFALWKSAFGPIKR